VCSCVYVTIVEASCFEFLILCYSFLPAQTNRSLSILVNAAAGNFLVTAEDLSTKGFKVGLLKELL